MPVMLHARFALVPFLAAGLLGAAACGGGLDDADDDVAVDARRTDATTDAGGDAPFDGPPDGPPAAPETSITARPPTLSNQRTARFELASTIPGSSFDCAVDGAAFLPCTSPYERDLLDGGHGFQVRAISPAGVADPTPASHAWQIDTTPPVTTFLVTPPALDNSVHASFQFESEPLATFACAVDGAAFAPCASPYFTVALADGAHAFQVQATDAAGNVEAPRRHDWTLDSGTPDTVIDSGPPPIATTTAATFTFASPDAGPGATFSCRLDNGAAQACTSPWTVAPAEGAHTARITVRDAAGNVDPSPATWSWTVDTIAPTVVINVGPSGPTNDATPTFEFTTGGAPVSTECRVTPAGGAADFAPCASPFTATTVADGGATFEVRVRDAAGLATTAQRGFVVDTVAPVVTITAGPTGVVTTAQVTFAFTAAEPLTWWCRVDNGAWATCSATYQSGALTDGAHTFRVYGADAAGNATTVVRTFTVDTLTPTLTITAGPSGRTADATPTFAFQVSTGGSAVTLTCQIDQLTPVSPCPSPFTPAPLGDGAHALTVTATDEAAHSASQTRAFTVDTAPLAVTITSSPFGLTTNRRPSMAYVTTGFAQSHACRVDSGPWLYCSNGWWSPSGELPEGEHTYSVEVRDDLGNVATATTPPFVVDSVAPVVVFTGGPTGTVTTTPVTFEFTTSGAPVVTECRLYRQGNASGGYQACGSPRTETLAPPSTPYPYTFEVRVRDQAGNQQSFYRQFTYAP